MSGGGGLWPDAEVVVLPSPAPVGVGEAVHPFELLFSQRRHSSEVALVAQSRKQVEIDHNGTETNPEYD